MLAFDPSLNFAPTSGNALPFTWLNNYPNVPSSVNFFVDCSQNSIGCYCQIWNSPSGIGSTSIGNPSGCLVQVFSTPDNTWYDTVSYPLSFLFTPIPSTIQRKTIFLDTGKYNIALTNQDPLNSIFVLATTGTLN